MVNSKQNFYFRFNETKTVNLLLFFKSKFLLIDYGESDIIPSFDLFLGSFKGMQSFIRFLQTTKGGYDLYRFWMDCEFFKDTMAGLDQIENVVARTRLFRDLNDGKYHLPFMRHLQNKIRRAYSDTAGVLTHDVFLQVQYDVLRRLRIYWSARFIIHQLFQQHHTQIQFPMELNRPANVCLYPIDQRTDTSKSC